MGDNMRRDMQNLNLGADDPPVQLPVNVVNEAAAGNRFVLIGRPVMPRRQNIRSIIATLPRNWGHVGVYGRMLEGRQFQFVFPSEEAMEMVLRRGPWAFADRMLIIERWTPTFHPLMLNFIPFWIQIRGIPFQFMSQDVVMHIGRALGMYMDVDYSADVAARRDYARVRVNWNVDEPLRFQRQFQFTPGVNTLLRLTFERLRGFCDICGRLTHDSGACLIQNGGVNHEGDDDDSDNDEGGDHNLANHGVIIEEIHEGEQAGVEAEPFANEELPNGMEDYPVEMAEDDDVGGEVAMHERHMDREANKRKTWLASCEENTLYFSSVERGESSGAQGFKRTKTDALNGSPVSSSSDEEINPTVRGAVGPEPPLPP
ncbi:uncharacterized protein LOC108843220 [Raphanus sativus]|uniref:Uncharacterized protein LOC108843220 n=1 Tax=Raphanus sativus TaxID=3726 RepID=A0A6J0MK43_RAPSA|nr:uncharacterized protein LOC108843220 [Raphanus sativus]